MQSNNVHGHESGCQKYDKGFEDGYNAAIKYDNRTAALQAKCEKLAMWLDRLRGSMMAHPDYVSGNNIEFIDRVDGAGEALAEWKGEKQPVPVWVKTNHRLPGWNQPVYWRIGEGPQTKGKTPLSEMFKGGYLENWQWLDESAGEKEHGAVAFAEWILEYGFEPSFERRWVDYSLKGDNRLSSAQLWDKYQKEVKP